MASDGAGFTVPVSATPTRKEASAYPAVALAALGFGPWVQVGVNVKPGVLAPVCSVLNLISLYSKPVLRVWRLKILVICACQVWVSLASWITSVAPSAPPTTMLGIEPVTLNPVIVMFGKAGG